LPWKAGRVLVGTTSIEKSEAHFRPAEEEERKTCGMNAKFHEKEAEIVAQAAA